MNWKVKKLALNHAFGNQTIKTFDMRYKIID